MAFAEFPTSDRDVGAIEVAVISSEAGLFVIVKSSSVLLSSADSSICTSSYSVVVSSEGESSDTVFPQFSCSSVRLPFSSFRNRISFCFLLDDPERYFLFIAFCAMFVCLFVTCCRWVQLLNQHQIKDELCISSR